MVTGTNSARDHSPDLRRALMRVQPEYYSWPAAAQEAYGASLPDEDEFRIRQTLLKALFRIDVRTPQQMDQRLKKFTDEQYLMLNSALLPLIGIGEDCFWLNEHLGDKTLLDFETLHDYDYDDYCFQEKANQEQFPDYRPRPYRGSLDSAWARLRIDDAFHYATLSMAAAYVFRAFEDAGRELIRELIPHEYVDGKRHGKRKGKGWIYDPRIDAGGLEPQLEELKDRSHRYLSDRYELLLDEFNQQAARSVYMIDRSTNGEPQMDFVFTDKTALRSVRFRYFMHDCRRLLRSSSVDLDRIVERERQEMIAFLRANYQDILANFDPTVVKFRKKREIVVLDGALDDLL